jgi:SAM-dependent methyltransferase
MKCRHCNSDLSLEMIDLGTAPPSNAYLTKEQLNAPERYYPLKVLVCQTCWLAQTQDFSEADELFNDSYAYFSSYSSTWLAHAQSYVEMACSRFALSGGSLVMEVASNDGYLLQFFKQRDIPCFGVEPTKSTADVAKSKGIDVVSEFFGQHLGQSLASSRGKVDLALGNNVLAHVPDINDFVAGFKEVLKPEGVLTFEFPHLLNLIELTQFDTVYHEHYSYLSLTTVKTILGTQGLSVFDVEELPTHGGSLRVFAQLRSSGNQPESDRVPLVMERERLAGLCKPETFRAFAKRAYEVKNAFVSAVVNAKRRGKRIAAYGAAAKGSTLLNYAGLRADVIEYVVDRNPHKQGTYLPGSRVPIVADFCSPRPDVVLIFPWNIKDEIMNQLLPILGTRTSFWTYNNLPPEA